MNVENAFVAYILLEGNIEIELNLELLASILLGVDKKKVPYAQVTFVLNEFNMGIVKKIENI